MITLNGTKVDIGHFPDGTLLIKGSAPCGVIEWHFENNEELVALIFLARHLREVDPDLRLVLMMPYIPNARMDRVKEPDDIFTLKHFAWVINSLGFDRVYVLDPHSYVSEALIDRVVVMPPTDYIKLAIKNVREFGKEFPILFYPDEGAMKRYSGLIGAEYAFGIKQRDWHSGQINGLTVCMYNDKVSVSGKNILIIDDICSRGGTFYHSATRLKELGAKDIYLYVTHCENTILDGHLLDGDLIKKVFTTNSIFTKQHEKIEVFQL